LLQQDPILNSQRRKNECNENDDDSLDEGWKMTPDMMEALDKSAWLRNELTDGGLRQIIHSIVTSSDRVERNGRTQQEAQLSVLKQKYPNFATFCDKLLTLTGVLERQRPIAADCVEGEELEPMEEWLQRPFSREELQQCLAIKSVPRRTVPKFEKVDQGTSSEEEEDSDDHSSSLESGQETEETNSSSEGNDDDDDDDDDDEEEEDNGENE
jgi:hypothetical protein